MGQIGTLQGQQLEAAIQAYLDQQWEQVASDIEALVCIPSFEQLDKAQPNAPFGPGPRAALDQALSIAQRMGLPTTDVDGYLAFADLPGESETQLGIIGHVDVVPDGPGWTVPPFAVTRRQGYLMGRGVIDDKGPLVVALHAVNFWKQQGVTFPYTIRVLFGAAEETGMADVKHYRKTYADPAFLFTPDADFPVCYGEKGQFNATFESAVLEDARIVDFQGGMATNAVPGTAWAVVRASGGSLPPVPGLTLTPQQDGTLRIDAQGTSAHASTPERGVSAIGLIVDYLLEQGLCSNGEKRYLQLLAKLIRYTDGGGLGIACADEHFGSLTVAGGTICMQDGKLRQTLDVRFPTAITADQLTARLSQAAEDMGAALCDVSCKPPFLVDPQSPVIQALLQAYNQATGEDARPFTMGGGTYAREFSRAASFGPHKPGAPQPAWAGSMHGPDEAVSEDLLKQAFRIYALTIQNLMELDLG